MKMENIEVFRDDGFIFIAQDGQYHQDRIKMSPEQVKLVCQWLKEAALSCSPDEQEV